MTEPHHHHVVIVGSGFAGLGTAIELKRGGYDDFVMLERADALGGTWQANHYPGCACDVPTPYYSFSFAPKPDWSRFYAPYDEIRAYLEECADAFGVRSHLRTETTVTALRWSEDDQRWTVDVAGAPAMTADFLVAAPGGLSRPAYPDIEGLGDFAGPWFHSAEWDHSVDLSGARIAVLGTGASSIQFVPRIARHAAHIDVFQRTPPWVIPKPDRRIPKAEQWLYRRSRLARRLVRGGVWAMQEWMGLGNTRSRRFTRPLEAIGRAEIRRSIKDPELRARLTPDYAIGCKRLLLANDWYPALARDDVDVVSDPIVRAGEHGLVTADGTERAADVIIFGTGFHATDPLGELVVEGRDGLTLAERWHDGMQAHRGTTISGFPNFFLMPGPNTGTGHTSQVFMIEAQIRHVLAAMKRARERGAATVEPRAEAQGAFNAWVHERMQRTVWLRGGCSSWYLDVHGRNTTLWPGSSLGFRRALRGIDDREFHFEAPRPSVPEPIPATAEAKASA